MRRMLPPLLVLLIVSSLAAAPPKFTATPAVARDGDNVTVRFAVDRPTDVAVTVGDARGKVVRHLAAGVLGDNAPEPLAAGKLEQSLTWDGRDDRGRKVDPAGCSVRVGLGLAASADGVIGQNTQEFGSADALAVGPAGEVYILSGTSIVTLDRNGKYQRQISPPPADLPIEKLAGLGPVKLADGSVYFRRSVPGTKGYVGSMAITPDGKQLIFPGAPRYARNVTRINTDGSVPANAFDTQLTTHADNGFLHLACSPDGKLLYAAGAEAGYLGDDAREVVYRQVVYRLRLDTDGPAEVFTGDDENSGGVGFSVNKPMGLACDAKGNLYVCNYGRNDVTVYTPGGGVLRSIEVKNPQQVTVHPKTGQVYVLAGVQSHVYKYGFHYPPTMHEAKLYRFSAEGVQEQMLELEPPFLRTRKDPKTGKNVTQPEFRARMAVDFSQPDQPIVWVGLNYPSALYAKWGLLRIVDEGKAFAKPADVMDKDPESLGGGAFRVILDSENDLLYLNGNSKLQRYTTDGKWLESIRPLNAKTGERTNWNIAEAALGPDGLIYFSSWNQYGYKDNFVRRMKPDGTLVPFTGIEGEVKVRHVMKGGGSHSARGFDVDREGNIYVLYYDSSRSEGDMPPEPWDRAFLMTEAVAKFAPDGKMVNERLISHLRSGGQGVRVDSRGNIYVSDNIMPVGVSYPRPLNEVLDDPLKRTIVAWSSPGKLDSLLRYMGSLFKFGPDGGQIVGLPEDTKAEAAKRPAGNLFKPVPEVQWFLHNSHKVRISGAKWQYHGVAPVPTEYQGVTHVERCVCRGVRFDVDPLDRVFVPDNILNRVTVLDSAGNVITQFGRPGNQDGGEGVVLVDPTTIAADASRAFITDGGRIVRVKLGYQAEASCPLK